MMSIVTAIALSSALCAPGIKEESKGEYGPPWACPLWPIMQLEQGTLYYCDYFDHSSCQDEPEPAYLIGNYNWPATHCSMDCESARHGKGRPLPANSEEFEGLEDRLTEADPYPLDKFPGGPAKRFSRVLHDEDIPFVTVKVDENTTFQAKVFPISVEIHKAMGESAVQHRLFYVALEIRSEETSSLVAENVELCWSDDEPGYAYRGTAKTQSGKQVSLLILRIGVDSDASQKSAK